MPRKNTEESITSTLRRDRFVRVCTHRVNAVIGRMRLLKLCGNRLSYEYSDADVESMFAALEETMAQLREAFGPKEKQAVENKTFSFATSEVK